MAENDMSANKNSVTVRDDVRVAFEKAMIRIDAVYASKPKTLIDLVDDNEWRAWDASKELCIVSDADGLEDHDPIDDGSDLKAA